MLGGGSGSSSLVNAYGQAVKKAGWAGSVTTVVAGSKGWSSKSLAGATAVVLVGDDPSALASTMADPAFRDAVTTAVRTTPVVLADGAMTAVLGSRWSAKAERAGGRPRRDRGGGCRRLPCRRRPVAARPRPGAGDARAAPRRRLPLGSALRRCHRGARCSSRSVSPPARPSCWRPSGASVTGRSVVVADGRRGHLLDRQQRGDGRERGGARRVRRRRGPPPLTRSVSWCGSPSSGADSGLATVG